MSDQPATRKSFQVSTSVALSEPPVLHETPASASPKDVGHSSGPSAYASATGYAGPNVYDPTTYSNLPQSGIVQRQQFSPSPVKYEKLPVNHCCHCLLCILTGGCSIPCWISGCCGGCCRRPCHEAGYD